MEESLRFSYGHMRLPPSMELLEDDLTGTSQAIVISCCLRRLGSALESRGASPVASQRRTPEHVSLMMEMGTRTLVAGWCGHASAYQNASWWASVFNCNSERASWHYRAPGLGRQWPEGNSTRQRWYVRMTGGEVSSVDGVNINDLHEKSRKLVL